MAINFCTSFESKFEFGVRFNSSMCWLAVRRILAVVNLRWLAGPDKIIFIVDLESKKSFRERCRMLNFA